MQNDLHIGAAKSALRRTLTALRRALTPDERRALSDAACCRVMAHPLWHEARTVVAYAATEDEVDTRPLLEAVMAQGKVLVLPAVTGGEIAWRIADDISAHLVPGMFGIAEPAASARAWHVREAQQSVLWLIPGVGFDRRGVRLGRGGGYYDRALRAAHARTATVGLAFPCQIVPAIPADEGDWRVESVATANEWIAAVIQ